MGEKRRKPTDEDDKPFPPEVLDKTVITIPLLKELKKKPKQPHWIIIDINLEYPGGRKAAKEEIARLIGEAVARHRGDSKRNFIDAKSDLSQQYLFAMLEPGVIRELVRLDTRGQDVVDDSTTRVGGRRALFRIWPDFECQGFITKSISTVKADAARNAFNATGQDILWAVMDSGIDGSHPHFQKYQNLVLHDPTTGNGAENAIRHRDFTGPDGDPLTDPYGHGTHVAGIIAGETTLSDPGIATIHCQVRQLDEHGNPESKPAFPAAVSGMAPRCKLLSLKVLDDAGADGGRETPAGRCSNIIAAIEYIQEINGYGRRLRVHGVNMSVGYDFEPKWFACGQSPLCVEVDRLVRSGVVVVVAAGNTGYGIMKVNATKSVAMGMDLSINDPGNADLAITVGSTHRESPHVYGVSYFSSKGPTGDGRLKPDVLAPGEKIISCYSTQRRALKEPAAVEAEVPPPPPRPDGTLATPPPPGQPWRNAYYREDSGTSMAAPHVSGVIASFLSIRREFIGQPERVKGIFLNSATDLRRAVYFQGKGLVDLMRAIQSV